MMNHVQEQEFNQLTLPSDWAIHYPEIKKPRIYGFLKM